MLAFDLVLDPPPFPGAQAGLDLIRTVVEIMPALTATLNNPGPPAALPSGRIPSRVGGLRMAAVLLVEALMRSEQGHLVFTAVLEHGVLELLLSVMLSYPTANMLHNSVCATVLAALSSGDAALRQCLIGPQCALLQHILTQYELHDLDRDGFQADSSVAGVFRPAYMGHLHRITESICELYDEGQLMECLEVGDVAAARRNKAGSGMEASTTDLVHEGSSMPIAAALTPREDGDVGHAAEGQQQNEQPQEDTSQVGLMEPPAVTKQEGDGSLESEVAAPPAVAEQKQQQQGQGQEGDVVPVEAQMAGSETIEMPAVPPPPAATSDTEPARKTVTRESVADVEREIFERWMSASSHEIMVGWRQLRAGGA